MIEARSVVKNKFWIVEENGHQVGTIQAVPDGVVLVQGQRREKFPTFKLLSSRCNIRIARTPKIKRSQKISIYNYPCDGKVYNPMYDLKSRLPIYTKEPKSKSFYCAGYYLVRIEDTWISTFCPKKITLVRNEYFGPFFTKEQLNLKLSQITN